jgi:hypothetical protein
MKMTKFAAYDNLSIYAVADTAADAIPKARHEVCDDSAEFRIAQVSDDLAARIERDGWDGSRQTFDIDNNGFIVDTTGQ